MATPRKAPTRLARRYISARAQSSSRRPGKIPRPRISSPLALSSTRRSSRRLQCSLLDPLVEIHEPDNPQIVERADDREQNPGHRKPGLPGVQQRRQHPPLGVEARQRRHANHAHHDQQHHRRKPWAAPVEPLEVIELLGLGSADAHQDHDAECGRGHHHVDQRVKQRRLHALGTAGQNSEENEPDVRDRRVTPACA